MSEKEAYRNQETIKAKIHTAVAEYDRMQQQTAHSGPEIFSVPEILVIMDEHQGDPFSMVYTTLKIGYIAGLRRAQRLMKLNKEVKQ